ncbi:IS5 family transposase [Pseudoruegeria sp. SK021]|uniref:IS5 family transposase n=1 Tax=Pseudoruegeria sp. SK021 TaxID=1933035 RepID=UPI000A22FC13|nr:IS5 family transposase [Pseudoruegeria sp. SK021]OSP53660.1 IS5 family transposase [Pseudoruegeria sp. SK021]
MPYKFNNPIRGKFSKARYRVTNWAEYNESLRRRGDVTLWFDLDLLSRWRATSIGKRGGKLVYSDLAIEICLTLRSVFGQALRQTQGLVRSLLNLAGIVLPVPDFSTLSRRGATLRICPTARATTGPITLIVDSTGLRVHGGRDWMEEKHGLPKHRKTWRKLHIGLDPDSGEIVASSLTTERVGDPTALPALLQQIRQPVDKFIADGAYDGQPTVTTTQMAFGADVEVIIPPPKTAIPGDCDLRNRHLETIRIEGRMAWQTATGYNLRSNVEAQIGRYKQVIGPQLRSRTLEAQRVETQSNRSISTAAHFP